MHYVGMQLENVQEMARKNWDQIHKMKEVMIHLTETVNEQKEALESMKEKMPTVSMEHKGAVLKFQLGEVIEVSTQSESDNKENEPKMKKRKTVSEKEGEM